MFYRNSIWFSSFPWNDYFFIDGKWGTRLINNRHMLKNRHVLKSRNFIYILCIYFWVESLKFISIFSPPCISYTGFLSIYATFWNLMSL